MGNLPLTFLPPQHWQDFEKLLRGVVEVIWEQDGWHFQGRPGQNQFGIDLFGYDNRQAFTGIQCKKKDATDTGGQILTIGLITEQLIDEEIGKASKITEPKLEKLIFATTSPSDRPLQDLVRKKSEQRKKAGLFTLDIWFWQDIQVYIERHQELMYWYFQDYLEKIHKFDKNLHILYMLRTAFTRPAYKRIIHREENSEDFLEAIKNTQEAITTGKLYNRRGELIITSFDYKKLQKKWADQIEIIYSKLDTIRDIFQDGVKAGQIEQFPGCIDVRDPNLADQLNTLRSEALLILNKVLKSAGLDPVKSELTTKTRIK